MPDYFTPHAAIGATPEWLCSGLLGNSDVKIDFAHLQSSGSGRGRYNTRVSVCGASMETRRATGKERGEETVDAEGAVSESASLADAAVDDPRSERERLVGRQVVVERRTVLRRELLAESGLGALRRLRHGREDAVVGGVLTTSRERVEAIVASNVPLRESTKRVSTDEQVGLRSKRDAQGRRRHPACTWSCRHR